MRKTFAGVTIALTGIVSGFATPALASPPYGSGDAVVQKALTYLGVPYTPAGVTPATGFNDLTFVRYVYRQSGFHLHVNRQTLTYWNLLRLQPQVAKADLQPGDLLFFKNTVQPGVSHVGIYVGDGKFVHAEWYGTGVTVTSFTNDPKDGDYWSGKYATARRPWTSG